MKGKKTDTQRKKEGLRSITHAFFGFFFLIFVHIFFKDVLFFFINLPSTFSETLHAEITVVSVLTHNRR